MTASAGGKDEIDFLNLVIFGAALEGAALENIFDSFNHEFETKSIAQSSFADMPGTIGLNFASTRRVAVWIKLTA